MTGGLIQVDGEPACFLTPVLRNRQNLGTLSKKGTIENWLIPTKLMC